MLGTRVPVALMTSFATDDAIREHVEERRPRRAARLQPVRLAPPGAVAASCSARATVAPRRTHPGHGDLFQALRRSGTLDALRSGGVRVVTISNVDNLGARVDPAVVGSHLLAGRPVTCEVARKERDMGGAPVRVNGKLQLLEGPRFPASFDQELAPVFNTNTALVDIDALDRDYDLTWLYVRKEVDGREAVQLERLYHEISAFVPDAVPRRPAPRAAWALLPDQDAGRSRARPG